MTAEPGEIRALTWNVHGFVGRAGRSHARVFIDAVRALNADIVALQELDDRPGRPDEVAFLTVREAFGTHSAEARTIRSPDGDYGHLLMSRWPMTDVALLDLAVGRREPRMAICSTVASPVGNICVLSTHLGLATWERRRQLAVIVQRLEQREDPAAIVLGDFNEWRPIGPATRALCPPFEIAASRPSFPSRRPLLALDRIWCHAPLRAVRASVATEYRRLSDHLPVVADLVYEPAAGG